jgi:hypothetical protein
MTHIESDKVAIKTNPKQVFDFVFNMNNIIELLPQEKVENWKGEEDKCSFTIKGLSGIGMKRDSTEEPTKIAIISHGKNPFDFTMNLHIKECSENESEAYLDFDANMNAMIEMMAKGPLTNLFNIMAGKLQEKFN